MLETLANLVTMQFVSDQSNLTSLEIRKHKEAFSLFLILRGAYVFREPNS
jgi:hypothetical protein